MDWRTKVIVFGLFVFIGLPIVITRIIHIPLQMREGVSPVLFVIQLEVVGVFILTLIIIGIHQYIRWEKYRPAIHLIAILIFSIVGTLWWFGPEGIANSPEPLTGQEKQAIRIVGAVLLFYLLMFVSHHFDDIDNNME